MSMDFSYYLLSKSEKNDFTPNDACRMAAYFLQDCNCYVTGTLLESGQRELHHRIPVHRGGCDTPINLVLLDRRLHKILHVDTEKQFQVLLEEFQLTYEQMQLVKQLRYQIKCTNCTPTNLNTSKTSNRKENTYGKTVN